MNDGPSTKIGSLENFQLYGIYVIVISRVQRMYGSNAPVSGMPHHPYIEIMWGNGRGFVQQIMPEGWGIAIPII